MTNECLGALLTFWRPVRDRRDSNDRVSVVHDRRCIKSGIVVVDGVKKLQIETLAEVNERASHRALYQ
jgi:hypothetical protein